MFAYFACITCLCLKFYSGNFNHHHHYNHHHYHYRHHHWCHCHCQILNLFNLTIKTKYHTLMIQKIYDFCHFCFYYHYDHHYHYHHHHWCHCHCQILNLFDLTIKTRYHTWCFKRFMIFVVVVVVVVDVIADYEPYVLVYWQKLGDWGLDWALKNISWTGRGLWTIRSCLLPIYTDPIFLVTHLPSPHFFGSPIFWAKCLHTPSSAKCVCEL